MKLCIENNQHLSNVLPTAKAKMIKMALLTTFQNVAGNFRKTIKYNNIILSLFLSFLKFQFLDKGKAFKAVADDAVMQKNIDYSVEIQMR